MFNAMREVTLLDSFCQLFDLLKILFHNWVLSKLTQFLYISCYITNCTSKNFIQFLIQFVKFAVKFFKAMSDLAKTL